MELASNDKTIIQLPLSALKSIGRGVGLSTSDRTVAKHHVSLKAEEGFVLEDDAPPPGNWWEKPPLRAGTGKGQKGLRAWVEVLGPNPICVLKESEEGKFDVRFLETGEGCWLVPGDQLSLSIVKPTFFIVRKAGAPQKESIMVQRGNNKKTSVTNEQLVHTDREGKGKREGSTSQGRSNKRKQSDGDNQENRGPKNALAVNQDRVAADRSTSEKGALRDVTSEKPTDEPTSDPANEDRAGQSGTVDPVKEYGLIVEGTEFDQYDQRKLNNTRPWTWQIRTSNGGNSDGETVSGGEEETAGAQGGSTRGAKAAPNKKKGRPDQEDEWTGDLEEETEEVEEVDKGLRGLGKAPAVTTRSHDGPRGKKQTHSVEEESVEDGRKGAGNDKTRKDNVENSKGGMSNEARRKGRAAKGSDTRKASSRRLKKDEGSEESEDDEPTAEELDFIVDDEEELEEGEEESEDEWEVNDDDDGPKKKSKAKQPAKDMRPMCRYGANCYRKNPDHLKQFRHP